MSIRSNHDQPESESHEGSELMRDCPFCGVEYVLDRIHVLKETERAHLAHMTCEKCGHAVIALFAVSEFGMSTLGIVTDMNLHDAKRIAGFPELRLDDVLNFHIFIRDGRLFEKHILLSAKGALEKH